MAIFIEFHLISPIFMEFHRISWNSTPPAYQYSVYIRRFKGGPQGAPFYQFSPNFHLFPMKMGHSEARPPRSLYLLWYFNGFGRQVRSGNRENHWIYWNFSDFHEIS